MEGIIIEGKTIDEAIEKACKEFQVPREKLNIEIIAEGNPGFLGLGATKAQIRAGLLSIDMAIDAVISRTESQDPVRSDTFPTSASQGDDNGNDATTAGSASLAPRTCRTIHSAAITSPLKTKALESQECKTTAKPYSEPSTGDDSVPPAENAKRLLEGLLARMDFVCSVTVEETEDAIILNIQGDGSGLLIGKRGQNLDAIQYIVNKAAHHTSNGHKTIVIDTEEYRQRREESLVALALKLGAKVKKTKKPVTVGHMNAHDRRVIHMAMQNDETLITKSRGEGEYRKILILPARRGQGQADA
jgi:spoIIIJ-associated protein